MRNGNLFLGFSNRKGSQPLGPAMRGARWAAVLLLGAFCFSLHAGLVDAQVLRIVDSSKDPLTLYPHNSFDPNSDLIISQIFEGLIEFDSDGRLIPRLAERWEKISPTRYRFWLRRGVTFHDGEPFDAEAVRFSLDQQLRGPRKSANAWLFDPDFHAEVVSSHVVDLVTRRPDARLPYTLPMFFKIVPPRYVGDNSIETLEQHPIGTGPYRFVEWKRGRYILLRANPDYWKPGLPHIHDLKFLFIDQDRQVPALLEGKADLVTKLAGKDTLEVMRAPDTEVQKRHVAAVFWAAMKNHDSPFANLKVRQAMNYAVNKRHLIQYVAKGNSLQVSSMTNPMEIGFNPTLHPYPFDPAKARQLLREAGYGHGFRVRVLASEDTKHMVYALKAQLRMVGVDLDITVVPREEYLRQTIIPKLRTGRPSFDGDMVIWLTPNPTLNAFFSPAVIFYSGSPYAIMQDTEFDRLYNKFVRCSDPDQIRQSIYRLQAYMTEQAFGIYTAQRVRTIALRRGLKIKLPPTDSLFGFTLAEAYWADDKPSGPKQDRRPDGPGPEKTLRLSDQ
jgi:peptide/nickel transport system substrate-binding protein